MSNDPFRIPPPAPEKEDTRVKDFFEGLDKVQYTLGWMFAALVAATLLSFTVHSCNNAELVQAVTVQCISQCGSAQNVTQFPDSNLSCECKEP